LRQVGEAVKFGHHGEAVKTAENAAHQNLSAVAAGPMQQMVQRMLASTPSARPNIMDYLACEFFHDMQAKCLQFLEAFPEKDKATKAQFLKQLTGHLDSFERRVLQQKILPTLLSETRDLALVQFILPNLLFIVRDMSQAEFERQVVPQLSKVFDNSQQVPQVMAILLQNLPELTTKFPPSFIRDHVVPMMCKAFDSEYHEIQVEVVKQLAECVGNFEYTMVKASLLPKLAQLTLSTKKLAVRVNCLICFSKIFPVLDGDTISGAVLNTITQCAKFDTTPAVSMACAGCLEAISNKSGYEVIAAEVLPVMLPLMANKDINYDQFQTIMRIIRVMLSKVEGSRLEVLGQKASLDAQVANDKSNILSGKTDGMATGVAAENQSFNSILGVKTNDSGFADLDMFGDSSGGPKLDFSSMQQTPSAQPAQAAAAPVSGGFADFPSAPTAPATSSSGGSMFSGMSVNSSAGGSGASTATSQPASGGSMFSGMSVNSNMGGSSGSTAAAQQSTGSMFSGMSVNTNAGKSTMGGSGNTMGGGTMGGGTMGGSSMGGSSMGGSTMGGSTMGGSTASGSMFQGMSVPAAAPASAPGGSMFSGMAVNNSMGTSSMTPAPSTSGNAMFSGMNVNSGGASGQAAGGSMFNGMAVNNGASAAPAGGSMFGGMAMNNNMAGGAQPMGGMQPMQPMQPMGGFGGMQQNTQQKKDDFADFFG